LGTSAHIVAPAGISASIAATTSAAPAIAGTAFGDTKAATSTSRSPAA
jgi:hypothetical protein